MQHLRRFRYIQLLGLTGLLRWQANGNGTESQIRSDLPWVMPRGRCSCQEWRFVISPLDAEEKQLGATSCQLVDDVFHHKPFHARASHDRSFALLRLRLVSLLLSDPPNFSSPVSNLLAPHLSGPVVLPVLLCTPRLSLFLACLPIYGLIRRSLLLSSLLFSSPLLFSSRIICSLLDSSRFVSSLISPSLPNLSHPFPF